MNIALNGGQGNTKQGAIVLPGYSDLTGKENYLWKIVNDSGTTKFDVPSAVTDLALFVGMSGDVAGNDNTGEAPSLNDEARVICTGTGNAGAVLMLDSSAWGKCKTLTATAGLYFSPGIAEEAWTAGQAVKFRPLPRLVSVKPTQTSAALTDNTGGSATTTLAAITAPAANATTSLTTDMTAVKNALASQAAQINALVVDVTAILAKVV